MTPEFYEIYEFLYQDYIYENDIRRRRRFPNNEYYLLRTIKQSIDTSETEYRLRPDAKYFLLVNFHNLIVRPMLESRPSVYYNERGSEFEDLQAAIQSDIATISKESKNNQEVRNENEVSGHQIMNTIDKNWKELKTTNFKIWG